MLGSCQLLQLAWTTRRGLGGLGMHFSSITEFLGQHRALLFWGAVLSAAMFVVSILFVGFLLIILPPTFFLDSHRPDWWGNRHRLLRWLGLGLKNLCGVMLVLLGIVLSLPGVPGQGLLTIVIGVALLDFPGKRRLLRWLMRRRGVTATINRLRARWGKPPFLLEPR